MWKYQNTDELYHYGILGMRWGNRKARRAAKIEKIRRESISETAKSRYGRTSSDHLGRAYFRFTMGSALGTIGEAFMLKGKAKTALALGVIGSGYAISGLVEGGKSILAPFPKIKIKTTK